ncbi:nitroreductase family protein [Chloroflexota bacterium]
MDYESLIELVKKRRSIRKFKPEPIPNEYVDKIIEVARWAPSANNTQPWEFIVVKKQELRSSMIQLIEDQHVITRDIELTREPELRAPFAAYPPEKPSFADAPVFIVLCGDPRTKDAYALAGEPQRKQTIFESSLAITCIYLHLTATTLGLASCWIAVTSDTLVEKIKTLLGISTELYFYNITAIGYPVYQTGPRKVRPTEEFVHHSYYDKAKFRTTEQVRDFIFALRQP